MNYAQAVRVYFDFCERLDAKKPLMKQGGKRPGKKCGKGYIAAERKCKEHYNESGKLTEKGKESARELAARVRARKGLKPVDKSVSTPDNKDKNSGVKRMAIEMQDIEKVRGAADVPDDKFLVMGKPELDFYNQAPKKIRWQTPDGEAIAELTPAAMRKDRLRPVYQITVGENKFKEEAKKIIPTVQQIKDAGGEITPFSADDLRRI